MTSNIYCIYDIYDYESYKKLIVLIKTIRFLLKTVDENNDILWLII